MYGRCIHPLTSRLRPALLLSVAAFACSAGRPPTRTELSPGIVFTHHIADGKGDGFGPEPPPAPPSGSITGEAGAPNDGAPAPSAPPDVAPPGPGASTKAVEGPPDPDPLRLADQWEYELAYDGGKLSVISARARRFDKPIVSARRLGRFAIELWIGPELVERVRFDFPGLGLEARPEPTGAKKTPLHRPVPLAEGLHSRQTVLVPAAPRARRAVLLDRATGELHELPWPPDHPLSPPPPPSP